MLGTYGVTGDISAGTEYGLSQALAGHLYAAGFDGVYYTARHDPAFSERSIAIFGGSGDDKVFAASTSSIPDELVAEAERDYALLVLPPYA